MGAEPTARGVTQQEEGTPTVSEKRTKQDRKLQLVTEQADAMELAKEQAKAIAKMYEDRDRKAMGGREHLVSQLEVTSDKYRTANGVMAALQTVRDVLGDTTDYVEEISIAKTAATRMAGIAQDMAKKAGGLDPEDMGKLCDGFYNPAFSEGSGSALEMIDELMSLQLCQNVGPSAQDVSDFCRTTDEEIEKAREELKKFCDEHDELDFEELCGPHDNCPDCLCMDCAKDCKEGKQIKEGQSAYDVCEDFVKQE